MFVAMRWNRASLARSAACAVLRFLTTMTTKPRESMSKTIKAWLSVFQGERIETAAASCWAPYTTETEQRKRRARLRSTFLGGGKQVQTLFLLASAEERAP